MPGFALRTLGFPEIYRGDRPSKLALRKGLALLIYLADAQRPVAREAAANLLWPEADPDTSRARLRRLLHRIEHTLGQAIFETDRTSIRWSSAVDVAIDSQRFESACDRSDFEEACRLYRGDFLAGFSLADCPEFEDWAFYRREALKSRLAQALQRVVQDKNAAGEHFAAAAHAGRLVELDPLSEVYGRHLIGSLLLAGDRSAAERHYEALGRRLSDELGVAPEAETRALMASAPGASAAATQPTRYARGAGVHLAFQTHGAGPLDILVLPGFVSHVERIWEEPRCRAFLTSLMTMGRVIVFDRRGVGLSDRIGSAPSAEATADDIATVLRAAETRQVILLGASEGGPACIKFAADEPRRVAGLVLFGSLAKGCWAPDHPFALRASQYDTWLQRLVAAWGGPAGIETFAPSLAGDAQARAWWAGLLRSASSPGGIKGVLEALRATDIRHLLPRLSVPTLVLHRRGDRAVRFEAGRYMASQIASAHFIELEGDDHWFFAGAQQPVLDAISVFVDGLARGRRPNRSR